MKIRKEFTLCASHILPNHPGKCSRLHGHNWKITVEVEGAVSRTTGMVLDFADVKRAVKPIIERLDHQHLNYYLQLPTAENLAAYFAFELAPELGTSLRVRVSETEPTEAEFDVYVDMAEMRAREDCELPGWCPPFEKFVVFEDRQAMLSWITRMKRRQKALYNQMHEVGAKLAAFEVYKDSLDEHEAARLLSELKSYEHEEEEVEK